MRQGQVIWSKGGNSSFDPRCIGDDEQPTPPLNLEVIKRGVLSKRKGFGRYREDEYDLFTTTQVIRGMALMYDSDGVRYLFVLYDGTTGTDLWIEKAGVIQQPIVTFFPTKGYRVRWTVFGDRIYFVNGVDRPRWYKEYDGGHIWGIAGVPSPARRSEDESDFDYFISRALYADCITSSEDLGIDPPGIWRYKQTIGYYGKQSDQQVEESNAGPASPMFHCQFNTAESLSATLEGYIKRGIPISIAALTDLILDAGESGGQDYGDEIRWTRLYRQHKMFSDEPYSPFEFLVEMKKGWPTSISDVYQRDSAVVAPTTRIFLPVAHHIASENNRLFLGRIEKELFTQPGLPKDFRGETDYKPNFSYRMPITIQNTNARTLTSAIIPLRFQRSDDTSHVATPPAGGGTWTGAYIDCALNFYATGWYQLMFVDEDGITPLGFCKIAAQTLVITLLVEIPEITAGGTRTIYLYFVDSQLSNDPESYADQPGHWQSIAHYPLCTSDHWLLADFENWDSGVDAEWITQKRSLGKIKSPAWGGVGGGSRQTLNDMFFNRTAWKLNLAPILSVQSSDGTERNAGVRFFPPSDSSSLFSIAFLASVWVENVSGNAFVDMAKDDGTMSVRFSFFHDGVIASLYVNAYDEDGDPLNYIHMTTPLGPGGCGCYGDWIYYFLTIDGAEMKLAYIYGNGTGHPAETSTWSTSGKYTIETASMGGLTKPIRLDSTGMYFGASVIGTPTPSTSIVYFKEMQILGHKIDLVSPYQEILSYFNRDGHWPTHGLATAGDRESKTGEKHPDRMYFSKLNQPNSFEAIDFRDMGEIGRPIQGIRGIRNRLFVFSENQIKALFSAGAEGALALGSGDTTMWNLSQDMTGDIGGLGILAPDTLVNMEFAGRDGVGFLSPRGFYFFDGQNFVHLSAKVDAILDEYGAYTSGFTAKDMLRYMTAHFLKKKRQLLLSPVVLTPYSSMSSYLGEQLVANMKFADTPEDIVWTKWRCHVAHGVERDFNIDDGAFVYACLIPSPTPYITKQLLKLEANTSTDTYKDKYYDAQSTNVGIQIYSKHYEVFDSDLIKLDFVIDRVAGAYDSYYLKVYEANVAGVVYGTLLATITNPQNAMILLPIGTQAKKFQFELAETSASALILHGFTFFYNQHGQRRLQGA